MALSKSTNTYNRQNWEQSEFPLLCQTCLGDNPYIRMIKDSYGDECRVCARPYTVFRWCPGKKMRYKRTEVCQSCAQLKNVCQTCLLDLEYGLPVQVRDSALNIKDTMPKSDVGREYYLQNMDQQMAESGRTEPGGALGKAQAPSDMLMKLARTTPYYKRNRPHICSFWVKGECSRGEECPYRHEMPTDPDDPLSNQKLKDRYHGVNDPVADKMLQQARDMPSLKPPDDKGITSLYIGGIDETFTDSDIRDNFYQFGEIADIHLSGKNRFGFVTFTTRSAAERAADSTFNKLIIKGQRLKILWGRSQPTEKATPTQLAPVPGIPNAPPPLPFDPFNLTGSEPRPPPPRGIPPPPKGLPPPGSFPPAPPGMPPPQSYYRPPPPGVPRPQVHYPSQNPAHLGAAGRK